MQSSPHRNRLASQSSAYLLQHAANPVDWYPWGSEALGLARHLHRPILLSIGYSACHWCHVMERECFENESIARQMNEHFVCIKVDREERPDVDHLYMKALQGMTGRGGWPMTMFLTPDAKPFFAGTYFPPEDRSGMPGLPRVLESVRRAWEDKHDAVLDSAHRVVSFLADDASAAGGQATPTFDGLQEVARSLEASIDPEHGGFGRAPKFPGTMALSLLMDAHAARADVGQPGLVRLSLDRMAAGGIRDHVGGGFHRYSVDQAWLVPHFEKMLYDQALLASLYTDARNFFDDRSYGAVAEEIFDYVVRELTSPQGGFYSAQDADSEGAEGKFFTWTPVEIFGVLGERRGKEFCEAYGVTVEGNFEGRTVLHRAPAAALPGEGRTDEASLAESRELLFRRRSERVRPSTDCKIVADWNGLMISAMAAASSLGREDLVEVAARAFEFVRTSMFDGAGLMHVHAGGEARIPAFLDDYAFFGRACLDLFLVRPRREYLESAQLCGRRLLHDFADRGGGAFFFSAAGGEQLVARICDLHDGAVPAGNSVAAELLARLWSITGEEQYRFGAQTVFDRYLDEALRRPYGASHLLCVAERMRRGLQTVVVVGERAPGAKLLQVARASHDPRRTAIRLEPGDEAWYPSALRGKGVPDTGAWAYVCENSTCSLPISSPAELASRLDPARGARETQ